MSTICTCDLCGRRIDPARRYENEDREFLKREEGYFTIARHKLVKNGEGKIIDHTWGDEMKLCGDCLEQIDAAVYEAVGKIRISMPKKRTIVVYPPYSDEGPVVMEDGCGQALFR